MRPKKRSAAAKAILPESPIKERISASAVNDDGDVDPEIIHLKMQMHIELKAELQKRPKYLSRDEIDFLVDLAVIRYNDWRSVGHDTVAAMATPEKAMRQTYRWWVQIMDLDGWRVSVSRDPDIYDPDDPF